MVFSKLCIISVLKQIIENENVQRRHHSSRNSISYIVDHSFHELDEFDSVPVSLNYFEI